MKYIPVDKNIFAFTIVELMVSITISIILLWGIFYFMSDTILGISRSSSQTEFLRDFYGFTTILDTGNLEILHDYTGWWFDVAMLTSIDEASWVLVWVVDRPSARLSPASQWNIYHESVLWYRPLSSTEISDIQTDSSIVYDYDFSPGNLFTRFNLRDFQLLSYNSGSLVEMRLDIFPIYNSNFFWESWDSLPQDEIFTYWLVF